MSERTASQSAAHRSSEMNNESTPSNTSVTSNKVFSEDVDLKDQQEEYGNPETFEHGPLSEYFGVLALCLMIAFGGFIFGWDTGTISGFVAQTDFKRRFGELNDKGEYTFTDVRTGLIIGIFNIGGAIGGLTLGRTGDMYGRRPGLMIVTCVYIVGIVVQISSSDKWYQYFIGRILSGMGVGSIAVLSPTLLSETAPAHLRGTAVAFYQFMITGGIFFGYCSNYGTKSYHNSIQWRVPLGLSFAWALFMIFGMLLVPESARYLAQKGRIEEAKQSLAKCNKCTVDSNIVTYELDNIMVGVEAERAAGSANFTELFSTRGKILQRVILGIMVQSLQQLTGDNYFFYYGTQIFQGVGLTDGFEAAIIIGIVNFGSTAVCLWTVERFGRRTCLLYGAAAMAVCFVIYASIGVTKLYPHGYHQPSNKSAGDVMIVFTCIFIFCFATTWAPVPYIICSEIYPLRVKGPAMAIAIGSNWVWGFVISFFTPLITNTIHFAYGYVFLGCLVFSYFYVFFVIPETKGLTLEEVNEMFIEGVLPWKSHGWVPSSKRAAGYDADAALHDDKPWYKAFF